MRLSRARRIAVIAATGLAVATVATSVAGSAVVYRPVVHQGAAHGLVVPRHRELGVADVPQFKVVLVAVRGPVDGGAPLATVRASAYRHTAHGWKLISTKRVGRLNGWFWYPVSVCSMTLTPRGPLSQANTTFKVRLLATPSIGCLGSAVLHW